MSRSKFVADAIASMEQELAILEPELKHKRTTRRPAHARLKMCMKYRDKNDSYHYSYDYFERHDGTEKYLVRDEREGLRYLKQEIEKQMRFGTVATAYIYICFENTDTLLKNYNFEIAHYVKGKTPLFAEFKWLEFAQQKTQDSPRRARLETCFNMGELNRWFKAFGFHQLVDRNGKPRLMPKKW